jgi:hypothetical protein
MCTIYIIYSNIHAENILEGNKQKYQVDDVLLELAVVDSEHESYN